MGKNLHATIPKGIMGYDHYTVPNDCTCRTYFCCFPLALENTFPWPFVPILSNFFEEQRTQNHPQYLSGLSRALFPITFLEIAVLIFINLLISPSYLLLSVPSFLFSSFRPEELISKLFSGQVFQMFRKQSLFY